MYLINYTYRSLMTPKCVRTKKRIIDVLNTPKVLFYPSPNRCAATWNLLCLIKSKNIKKGTTRERVLMLKKNIVPVLERYKYTECCLKAVFSLAQVALSDFFPVICLFLCHYLSSHIKVHTCIYVIIYSFSKRCHLNICIFMIKFG